MRSFVFNSPGLSRVFICLDGPIDSFNLSRICQSPHRLSVRSAESRVVGTDRLPADAPLLKRQRQIIRTGINIQAGIRQKMFRGFVE